MRNATFAGLAILLLSVSAACASSSHAQKEEAAAATPPPAHHGMGAGKMAGMCPMEVPGTSVAASDVEGGEALSFTTTNPDEVQELRQRVDRIATMHNEHHGQGGMAPPATAAAEDIPGGARIIITPTDPARLDEVRTRVREHAAQMAEGRCPGMHPSSGEGPGADEQEGDE